MGHNHHEHTHDMPMEGHALNRVFLAGILLNLAFVVLESLAAWWSGSMALWSDAAHNLADIAGLIISLIAFKLATIAATRFFTYGYHKTTIFAGLINAIILLLMVVMLVRASIDRFYLMPAVKGDIVMFTAAVGILINGITAWLFYRSKQQDINVKSAFLHMFADALVSAAVLLSGFVTQRTGLLWIDPVTGLLVALVIFIGTIGLLRKSVRMTLDGVPHAIDFDSVKTTVKAVQGVSDVHHIHVWAISSTQTALTAHLVLLPNTNREDEAAIKAKVKHELQHIGIGHVTLETETIPCQEHGCC